LRSKTSLVLPEQKLSAVAVSNLTIGNGAVHFESRESLFAADAKLSPDGRSLDGEFISAFLLTVPVPIHLHWVSDSTIHVMPISTAAIAKDLEGTWQGSLKYGASWEENDPRAGSTIAVKIKLSNTPSGPARGGYQKEGSPDPELPLSIIQQNQNTLRFEIPGAGVAFTAELHNGELSGMWRQFDLDPAPLTLRRARSNP